MSARKITRRQFITTTSAATAALMLGAPGMLRAEDKFPSEPIDLIVPFSVGGGSDIWMRTFSVALAVKGSLNVPVNIRNLPGAASLRGTGMAFTAKPDGYNLVSFNPPSTPWAWYIHQPPFDITQFKGVSVFVREPGILVCHPDSAYKTYEAMAEGYNSGKLNIMASLGIGTIWHVAALLLTKRNGVKWGKYVSYKGTGDVIAALLRKEVEVGIITASSAIDHVRDKALAPIAMIGIDKRLKSFPDVPTMNEFGKDPLKECVLRRSVFAPAGIPEDRRKILEEAFIKAQDSAILKAQYESLSLEPAYGDGAEAEEGILGALKVAEEINLRDIQKKK